LSLLPFYPFAFNLITFNLFFQENTMSAELKQKIQDLKGRLISLKEHL